MRADPGHEAERPHLELAAQRLVLLPEPVDLGDHRLGRPGVQTAHWRVVDSREVIGREIVALRRADRRDLDHVAVDAHPDGAEEALRQRAGCHSRGGLPRAGSLEDVADVREPELLQPGEIRVTGTRQVGLLDLGLDGPRVHPLVPIRVVAVRDQDGDRAAEGPPVPDARADLDRVAFDLHPAAAAMSELAPRQVAVERLAVELEPGRQALHDRDQPGAVRFPGCCESQAHGRSVDGGGAPPRSQGCGAIAARAPRARKGANGIARDRAAHPWRISITSPATDPASSAIRSATSTSPPRKRPSTVPSFTSPKPIPSGRAMAAARRKPPAPAAASRRAGNESGAASAQIGSAISTAAASTRSGMILLRRSLIVTIASIATKEASSR